MTKAAISMLCGQWSVLNHFSRKQGQKVTPSLSKSSRRKPLETTRPPHGRHRPCDPCDSRDVKVAQIPVGQRVVVEEAEKPGCVIAAGLGSKTDLVPSV
jgi:hypothetical protein